MGYIDKVDLLTPLAPGEIPLPEPEREAIFKYWGDVSSSDPINSLTTRASDVVREWSVEEPEQRSQLRRDYNDILDIQDVLLGEEALPVLKRINHIKRNARRGKIALTAVAALTVIGTVWGATQANDHSLPRPVQHPSTTEGKYRAKYD